MVVLLKLKNIVKSYDGNKALRGIDLDVKRGEVMSIIGPNGAGKTTLLNVMALLDEPNGGEIYYKGVKAKGKNFDDIRKKITMVFQQPVLFNNTVFENIAYGLRIRGFAPHEVERKVSKALEFVRLSAFADRRAKKLSGGEQQRIVLARALALNPEILLLDEPTANLDPANTILMEKIIKELRGKTTVVITTHNLFQARRLSDRSACLLDGELIDIGRTREIFTNPKDQRTKKFIRGEFF